MRSGAVAEAVAALLLLGKGYRIVGRNVHAAGGELDIVAKKSGMLVFTEVKYRRDDRFGRPDEFVDDRKQAHLKRAALGYMNRAGINPEHTAYRFDVIAICGWKIAHIKQAFS